MKKTATKFLTLMLTVLIVLSLAGCGEVQKAEKSIDDMFAALKSINYDELSKYIDINDLKLSSVSVSNEVSKELIGEIFKNLDYNIISAEKTAKDEVVVKTSITATDMKPVLKDYMSKMFDYALSGETYQNFTSIDDSTQKMKDMFLESIAQYGTETVTNEVDIKVSDTADGWRIRNANEDLVNALLGGMIEAAKDITNEIAQNFANMPNNFQN